MLLCMRQALSDVAIHWDKQINTTQAKIIALRPPPDTLGLQATCAVGWHLFTNSNFIPYLFVILKMKIPFFHSQTLLLWSHYCCFRADDLHTSRDAGMRYPPECETQSIRSSRNFIVWMWMSSHQMTFEPLRPMQWITRGLCFHIFLSAAHSMQMNIYTRWA